MSIIVENDETVVVCHQLYTKKVYRNTLARAPNFDDIKSFQLKEEYFAIGTPFIEEGIKIGENILSKNGKRKRRKRKSPFSMEEIKAQEHHELVVGKLQTALDSVKDQFKTVRNSNIEQSMEKKSSKFSEIDCSNPVATNGLFPKLIKGQFLTENGSEFPIQVKLDSDSLLIPGNARYLMSDMEGLKQIVEESKNGGKYNCIVMDPPWENKSVKRGKKYNWLSFDDIIKMPVPQLTEEGCYVIVWVTNKQRIMNFVKKTLFPMWNIDFQVIWHWVKVTIAGKPLYPFDSLHKKPYETIIIGRYNPKRSHQPKCIENMKELVICSIPCSQHSHKPPLSEILQRYTDLQENSKCLEMFARNLIPGWTSWGNEVLKFQNVSYFEEAKIS
nr:methyltransferase-like protein 4 [Ciona intestinalis]|eukprot:XP_002127115.1 methyltransferase-like protein 4 [Ciona intestinalis]